MNSRLPILSLRHGVEDDASTGYHGSEFSNLSIDMEFLLFKTFDGGRYDFRREFLC
jgi:hypothetical protein